MKPLRSPRSPHASQDTCDADKLNIVCIGKGFVLPSVRDSPAPREYSFLVLETDPLVGINVKRCGFLDNVAGSSTDPHHRRMFGMCVVGRRQLECLSEAEKRELRGTHLHRICLP